MIATFALRVFLVGMALATAGGGADAQGGRSYGLVHADAGTFDAAQLERGVLEAAKAAGAQVSVHDAQNDPTGQAQAIARLAAEDVDGLIVQAIDAAGIVPTIEEAAAAGVPVVAVGVTLAEPAANVQIAPDDAGAGAMLGQFIAGAVTATGEAVTLGVVGASASTDQAARLDGFTASVEDVSLILPGGFAEGHDLPDAAAEAAADLLEGNPEISALLATGDAATIGALEAAEAEQAREVVIYGWGLSLPIVEAIEAGRVQAAVHIDHAAAGRAAVQALEAIAAGETPDPAIDAPATIVTLQNVHEFRPLFR